MWREYKSAKAQAYAAALAQQSQDWDELGAECNAICVAGDFNQALGGKFYYWSNAAEKMLRDALLANQLVAATGDHTDPVREITAGRAACIDHICMSGDLARRQKGVPTHHHPVINGQKLSGSPSGMFWLDLVDI